ncbi:MAG: PAS domain S-box protein, partial [Smithellaceae bacterium]|nr:PAS domain S-box protein [Smithellaceae bacterium]
KKFIQCHIRDITERKRTEKRLKESEERYRRAFETARDGQFLIDKEEGRIVNTNPAIQKLLGYSNQELMGKTLQHFGMLKDKKNIKKTIKELERVGFIHDEVRIKNKEGNTIDAEMYLIDKAEVIQCNIRDITERKLVEDALDKSKDQLSNAVKIAHLGPWEYDAVNDLFTFTDSFYAIFRTTAEQVGGYTMSSAEYAKRFVHPDDAAVVGEEIRKAIETEDQEFSRQLEHRIIYSNGDVGYITMRFFIVKDENGRTVRTYGVNQDITEHKLAEKVLRNSERKYSDLFEFLPLAVYEITPDGKLISANRAAYELSGYSREDIEKGMNIAELLLPEDWQRALAHIPKLMAGKRLGDNEFTIVKKDGGTFPALIYSNAVKRDGKAIGIRGAIVDISERKESLGKLRQALGATIAALAFVAGTRDPYTAGHQRRVADLATAIAAEMNISAERIDGIHVAASIHDIGKISVPGEILSKPSMLSKSEFDLIKVHSQAGYNILKGIEFPWPIARMVLEHHERMDGSGYPQELKGDDILLESRIISVADVVEAMASHRPYRPTRGIDAALEEITKNRGILYDAAAVDACLKLHNEKGYSFA